MVKFGPWTFAANFWSSKTTHASILAIVTAVVTLCLHDITWQQFSMAVFAALQTAFVRDSLAKVVVSDEEQG